MITTMVSKHGYGVKEHSPDEIKTAIYAVERLMSNLPTVEIKEDHFFSEGLYSRTIFIPKGCWITGKLHSQEDLLIIASGDVTIYTENGTKRVQGPCVTKVMAGVKPLAYAHEDTVAINVHPNPDNTQDLEVLESRLITPGTLGVLPEGASPWLG